MRELHIVEINHQLVDERKEYVKVTNSGVICDKCKKPLPGIEFIKIFKFKNYPSPEDFIKW